jgi:hypothetical protein
MAEVQRLGFDLHQRLETAVTDPGGRALTPDQLTDLGLRLDEIAAAVDLVPDELERELLRAKIEQLQGLVYNLELVLAEPAAGAALPSAAHLAEGRPGHATPSIDLSPANDGCSNATPVDLGASWAGDTTDASNDGRATCGASYFSPDVWFRFTAPFAGIFYATTIGSAFDTVLSTHGGCPGTVANEIDCNDDTYGLWSSIRLDLGVDEEVLIRLAGANGSTGPYLFNIETDARIGGRITAADGGAPIEGIRAKVFNRDGAWIASDESDANGDYLVSGLNEVEHFIGTAYGATTYLHELWDDLPCPQGVPYSCDPTTGNPLLPALGATTTADFALDQESVITGTVTAAGGGGPIEYVLVDLYDDAGAELGYVYTDHDGTYGFSRLTAGAYRLGASHEFYWAQVWDGHPCPGGSPSSCDPTTGDPVTVPLATTVGSLDFALADQGSISGMVTEAGSGLPLSGIQVEAVDRYFSNYYATTEVDGSYRIRGLADGVHYAFTRSSLHVDELYDDLPCEPDCDPSLGTPIPVTLGAAATGVDFDLVRLGSLGGTVTEAGSGLPLGGLWVDAFAADGSWVSRGFTDPSGSYTIESLTAGPHFVVTDADLHADVLFDGIACPFGCDPTTGTPVAVQLAATTAGVDFALEPTGGISGMVFDLAAGVPLVGVRVELWHPDVGNVRSFYTDASGAFEFDDVPPGIYFVATDRGLPFLDELYDGIPCWGGPPAGCDPTKGTPITVTAGGVTPGIDIGLLDLDAIIFVDGFESGGAGGWSSVTP